MKFKRLLRGAALFAAPALMLAAVIFARAMAQVPPPNTPPPGAYTPIPNFSGVGAGLLFREAINDRFSGVAPISPAMASLAFANLPAERDGLILFCSDCQRTTPCASGGAGAWAVGERGVWRCSPGTLEADLNAGSHKVASLASGSSPGDALAFGQSGAQLNTLLGSKTDGSNTITGFSVNGVYNVKAYGAKGDHTTDDTAASQAAINAACAAAYNSGGPNSSVPSVFFPAGSYLITAPLVDNCGFGMKLYGAGQQNSVIYASNPFPELVIEPPNYASTIGAFTDTALATGGGVSLHWPADSNPSYFLNLKDAATGTNNWPGGAPLGGRSALTVRGWFTFTGGGSNGTKYYLLTSTGDDSVASQNLYPNGAIAIDVVKGSPSTIHLCLSTTGTANKCVTGGSISNGTTYFFELDWDGSNLYAWLGTPGNTVSQVGTTQALTGALVERVSESFLLGDAAGTFGSTGGFIGNQHWAGDIDGLEIANVARCGGVACGTAFTAPSAKFAGDGNTLVLLNNTTTLANVPAVGVTKLTGTGGTPPAWLPIYLYAPLVAGSAQQQVTDLAMVRGTIGLLAIDSLYGYTNNLYLGGTRAGLVRQNLSYGWHDQHLYFNGIGSTAEACLELLNSGLNQIDTIENCNNPMYGGILADAGGNYGYWNFSPQFNTQVSLAVAQFAQPQQGYYFQKFETDAENGGNPGVPVRILGGTDMRVNFGPGVLAPGTAGTEAVDVIAFGMDSVHFDNMEFDVNAAPELIHIVGGSNLKEPVLLNGGNLLGAALDSISTPLADDMTRVQLISNTSSLMKLTGARTDGGNSIDHYSVNKTQNVHAYARGGSMCSATTATATATAGSPTVTVSAIGDFHVGDYVQMDHAGANASAVQPAAPMLALRSSYAGDGVNYEGVNGHAGCITDGGNANCTSSWSYATACVDSGGGTSQASSTTTNASGPATLSIEHTNDLQWAVNSNCAGYAIYGCSGASCALKLRAIIPPFQFGNSAPGFSSGHSGNVEWFDEGQTFGIDDTSNGLGSAGSGTPPGAAVAKHYYSQITAISGTSVTLSANLGQSGSFTMRHDDSVAINSAIAAANTSLGAGQQGGNVLLPNCPAGSSGNYQVGQKLAMYLTQGVKLSGAGGHQGTIRTVPIAWRGPAGGSVFDLNQSQHDLIEYISIPGLAGTTPGVGFDIDRYDNGGGLNVATSADTLQNDEVGCAAYGVAYGARGTSNVDMMTLRDVVLDDGGTGKTCWAGVYYGEAQAFREDVFGGQVQNKTIDFITEGGSQSVFGAELSGEVRVWNGTAPAVFNIQGSNLEDNGRVSVLVTGSGGLAAGVDPGVSFSNSHLLSHPGYSYMIDYIGASYFHDLFDGTAAADGTDTYYLSAKTPRSTNDVFQSHSGGNIDPFAKAAAGYSTINDGFRIANQNVINGVFASIGKSSSSAPTVASCGSSASVASGGTNSKFVITIGSTNPTTSCTVTFANNGWGSAPVCTFQDITKGISLSQNSLTAAGVTLGVPSGVSDIHGDTVNALCIE